MRQTRSFKKVKLGFVGIFYVCFCLVFAMPLCASVYVCFVVAWDEGGGGAGLLALVCGV